MRLTRLLATCLSFSLAGCLDGPEPAETLTEEIHSELATCIPAPPLSRLQCNPNEPPPPPPPINGQCTIEVRGEAVGFSQGQGWFEGKAEAAASLTATDLDTGAAANARYPSNGTIKMEVGKEHFTNLGLGTYVVQQGDTKDVKVCATFLEVDGWPNADDLATECTTLTLTCPQPGFETTLADDLCKGGDCSKLRGRMSVDLHVLTADADRDCVDNEADWTPEPCDEALKGQLCRGSLVHFAYEDGPLNDLVQNLGTDLAPAMTGYDRVILLIDDADVGPFNLNPAALGLADIVMLPSEANFFGAMRELTADGCDMDIWNFTHGMPDWDWDPTAMNPDAFSGGGEITTGDDDEHQANPATDPDISTDELLEATDPAVTGTSSIPVRMTYATSCHYEEWNDAWLDVGAKVTAGSIDINFIPNRYERFVSSWNLNNTYAFSLTNEPSAATEALAFGFLAAQGAVAPWWCVGNTILGTNPCAFNFFNDSDHLPTVDPASGAWISDGVDEAQYAIGGPLANLAGITYDPLVSGAVNMRRASAKVRVGTGTIRKGTAGLTWP